MKNNFFITGIFALVLMLGVLTVQAKVVDRIVAIVNDDIVTLSELNAHIRPFEKAMESRNYPPAQKKEALYRLRKDAISQLVEKKLTEQEVVKLGIVVGDEEVDHSIEQIKDANFFTEEELRAALQEEGMTLEKLKEDTKDRLQRSRLVNISVKSKIVITTEDIQKYYDAHPEKYSGSTLYKLRHIVVAPGSAGMDEAKSRMLAIADELKNGADFEALAQTKSDSPLADQGGLLGEFDLGSLSPEISEAVKNLSPGGISEIVVTPQGLQLFYLLEKKVEGGKSLDDASEEIRQILYNEIIEEKFKEWVTEMKESAYIKIIN